MKETELKLKELRKERKLTQTELAQKLGVHNVSICRWENGVSEPSLAEVKHICEVLGVTSDALLGIEK